MHLGFGAFLLFLLQASFVLAVFDYSKGDWTSDELEILKSAEKASLELHQYVLQVLEGDIDPELMTKIKILFPEADTDPSWKASMKLHYKDTIRWHQDDTKKIFAVHSLPVDPTGKNSFAVEFTDSKTGEKIMAGTNADLSTVNGVTLAGPGIADQVYMGIRREVVQRVNKDEQSRRDFRDTLTLQKDGIRARIMSMSRSGSSIFEVFEHETNHFPKERFSKRPWKPRVLDGEDIDPKGVYGMFKSVQAAKAGKNLRVVADALSQLTSIIALHEINGNKVKMDDMLLTITSDSWDTNIKSSDYGDFDPKFSGKKCSRQNGCSGTEDPDSPSPEHPTTENPEKPDDPTTKPQPQGPQAPDEPDSQTPDAPDSQTPDAPESQTPDAPDSQTPTDPNDPNKPKPKSGPRPVRPPKARLARRGAAFQRRARARADAADELARRRLAWLN